MDARENAKKLMRHYMQTVFQAAGLRWDHDTAAEMDDLVDNLIDAAKGEIQQAEDDRLAGSYGEYINRYGKQAVD